MFDKKSMKKMALKSLMDMLDEDEDRSEKGSKVKATIMADSEEGLLEGAKKLPEILSKSEEYMKKRMGEFDKPEKKKKKK